MGNRDITVEPVTKPRVEVGSKVLVTDTCNQLENQVTHSRQMTQRGLVRNNSWDEDNCG